MSAQPLEQIMDRVATETRGVFGISLQALILFGSYARQEADAESDIDIMLLLDLPHEQIPSYRRAVAEISARILYEYGVVISPILENVEFFERNRETYPFFRNVYQEGIWYALTNKR